jgi:exodeoxyribonuclease III
LVVSILSWNIMHGGGSRITSILATLKKIDATFIVLSEFRHNKTGEILKKGLLDLGYKYLWHEATLSDDNIVIVASKTNGNQISIPHQTNESFKACMMGVDFGAFTIVGAYMPHKKKHNLFDSFAHLHLKTKNIILVGDLNTGVNFIDQKGDSFWYQSELKKMIGNGMIDAFRLRHGKKLEYSWYSHQGNGFRYDHTFVDEGLTGFVKDCDYLHEYRQQRVSDHSPMLMLFGI